jgi:hypothetical protein
MTDRSTPSDRRLDRRIPLGSPARIILDGGDVIAAQCVQLSVSGMTLHADYVPGEAEVIEVEVHSPPGAMERPPLVARVEVRRCHQIDAGLYEIGGSIIEIVG